GLTLAATRQQAKATPLAGGYRALSEKAPQATFSNKLGPQRPRQLGEMVVLAAGRAVGEILPEREFSARECELAPRNFRLLVQAHLQALWPGRELARRKP